MRKTFIVLSGLSVLLLALTGCQSMTGENKIVPTVSVSASATVSVVPDSASFSFTAESMEATTEEARNAPSLMTAKAVDILKNGSILKI